MSTGAQQTANEQLGGRPGHLVDYYPSGNGVRTPPEKEREYFCLECDRRVTVSPNGEREYGHCYYCDHSVTGGEVGK